MKRYLIIFFIGIIVLSCKKQVIHETSASDAYNYINESGVPVVINAKVYKMGRDYPDDKIRIGIGEVVIIYYDGDIGGYLTFPFEFRDHKTLKVYFNDEVYMEYYGIEDTDARNPAYLYAYEGTERRVSEWRTERTWTYTFTVEDYEYALANGTPVEKPESVKPLLP